MQINLGLRVERGEGKKGGRYKGEEMRSSKGQVREFQYKGGVKE